MKRSELVAAAAMARHKMWCPFETLKRNPETKAIHMLCSDPGGECSGPNKADVDIANAIVDAFIELKQGDTDVGNPR